MLDLSFVPRKPFQQFKWKWASVQCTEGINNPIVLLGVLSRMRQIEGKAFSSKEFAAEMKSLQSDLDEAGIRVEVGRRTGERNLMRNSKQYWTATGLLKPIPGKIELTDFGRRVADRKLSQTEFAATTIQRFRLPNPAIQSEDECRLWELHGISFRPLHLILSICTALHAMGGEGYLSTEELVKIIIPLSSAKADISDYTNFIVAYRQGRLSTKGWDDYTPMDNDVRIAREFLLFLSNYGFLRREEGTNRLDERYVINDDIVDEINELLKRDCVEGQDVTSEIDRKQVNGSKSSRPNQARFRREVIAACGRCIVTSVSMPEILEAAHIVPFKYKGADTPANGFAMRTDIHDLYDLDYLRISVEGEVVLSDRTRMNYGYTIPPKIEIPDHIDRECIRWRWENYHGL